jgi:DnaJ-class molecular chaperone
MRRQDAIKLLDLGQTFDPNDVREAFSDAVKADHPDHGGTGTNIARLKAARDILLLDESDPLTSDFPCITCKGSGYVKAKMAKRPCEACDGTGERRGH